MNTSDLLCPLDDVETSDRHELPDQNDEDDIWSSDGNQSDTNGPPADSAVASDNPFPVQQFFSEDDISDEDESPDKLGPKSDEMREDAANGSFNSERSISDSLVPLGDSAVGAVTAGARARRRKRTRDSADSLARDIWLPLYGMTLLEEEALPALALCPSRYILLRYAPKHQRARNKSLSLRPF